LGPKSRANSIKPTTIESRAKISRAALYLEFGPILLEVDCTTSNGSNLLKNNNILKIN